MIFRQRIDGTGAGILAGMGFAFDLVKLGFLFVPFVGVIINWLFVAPASFFAIGSTLNIHYEVHWEERLGARLFCWLVLGAIPFSTTAGIAATVVGVWWDDARYNKEMAEKLKVVEQELKRRSTAREARNQPVQQV